MVAGTYTQRLAEPVYHTDNSAPPSKHEQILSVYATISNLIFIAASCPKIVQWDTINYNQSPLTNLI